MKYRPAGSPAIPWGRKDYSRRRFLWRAAEIAAATTGATWLSSNFLQGAGEKAPAINRINIAMIGLGRQAYHANLLPFLASPDTQVVAVCDVDQWRAEQGRKRVEDFYAAQTGRDRYRGCLMTADFQEVLARREVDAVMISTPDHWHALMAVEAAKAGKDVALEKPISLSVAQGRAISDVMRRYQRIFRTDTEVRFSEVFRKLCEVVRNGRLGKVRRIVAGVPAEADPVGRQPPAPVPPELDYARWLGPAPEAPYSEKRVHTRQNLTARPGWMIIPDYCDGIICNWGTHLLDIVQWGNNTERTGPVTVEGKGEFHPAGGLSGVLKSFEVHYEYASGVQLTYHLAGRPYVRFEGDAGWVEAEWWKGIQSGPKSILEAPLGPHDLRLPLSNEKLDFINSVKQRRESLIPAEVGHRTNSMGQLGLISIQLGRKLRWDPDRECFPGDEEASRRLQRPLRTPWKIVL